MRSYAFFGSDQEVVDSAARDAYRYVWNKDFLHISIKSAGECP
jgi:hypothetical protein